MLTTCIRGQPPPEARVKFRVEAASFEGSGTRRFKQLLEFFPFFPLLKFRKWRSLLLRARKLKLVVVVG